jgi:hypothetical protein
MLWVAHGTLVMLLAGAGANFGFSSNTVYNHGMQGVMLLALFLSQGSGRAKQGLGCRCEPSKKAGIGRLQASTVMGLQYESGTMR